MTERLIRLFVIATALSASASAAAAQQARMPLQAEALEILGPGADDWGVMAWSITREQPLISINASAPRIPASNNKIFTAIWALDTLGPDYRFPTDLLVTGDIADGVLHGDVVIRGSGDPAFGYPPRVGHAIFVEAPMTPLRKMAQELVERGVRVVDGNVVGDATVFDTVLVGPNWPRDTGAGAAQYAPRVSGLPFQRNMLWLEAIPNPRGGLARIVVDPPVDVIPVVSTVRTGGSGALAIRRADEDTIRIRGSVSGNRTFRYGVGVAQPALLTTGALRTALEEAGIRVRGGPRLGKTPEDAELIHRHLSIPLRLMIPFLNQDSDNFFAEHLWKASAAAVLGKGSYLRGGPVAALHFIEEAGVPPGEMYQFDGSGLSANTRVTANAIVHALIYANSRPYAKTWHNSLAVAADPGGTMNRLYRNTAAAGNLHAKTGYIDNVRTLSGYVTAADGELIAFSFLYNGRNTSGARSLQTELGVLLAEYTGR